MTPSRCACVINFIAKYRVYTTIVVYRWYFAMASLKFRIMSLLFFEDPTCIELIE